MMTPNVFTYSGIKSSNILIRFNPFIRKSSRALIYLVFITFFVNLQYISAQTIPIDDIKEEQLRIQQLIHGSNFSSFNNRPVWRGIYDAYMDLGESNYGFWSERHSAPEYNIEGFGDIRIGVYEPSFRLTNNSSLPHGWNNESAWYGRGINTEISGGFWVTSDYLTITIRPTFTTHQNSNFEVPRFIPRDDEGNMIYGAEGIDNVIDLPFQFGPDSFSTFNHGYTSIRAHFKMIELGYSTEPMWWGPNVLYPLLMSNNAPGMKHLFLGSRSPVRIPYIGKLEFRFLGAYPENSEYFDQLHTEIQSNDEMSVPDEKRFMNGINVSFSPSFAPNFSIGWARAVHTHLDNNGLSKSDLGMVFDPILLENFIDARGPLDLVKPRNHLTSIYSRWIWPESRFELYGEFFRDDFSWDSRDFMMEPRHNSGYAFGFQKLVDAPFAHFYKVNFELTNLTPSFLQEVRSQFYYYTHPELIQGHTNRGQILGAAIGPGSNSQYLSIDGYQDWGRIGIFARRLANNNHFHFEYDRFLERPEEFRQGFGDYWRHRIDLTLGARGLFNHRDFIITGEVSWTKLLNYGRFDYGRFGGLNVSNFTPYDLTNIQLQVSVSYKF